MATILNGKPSDDDDKLNKSFVDVENIQSLIDRLSECIKNKVVVTDNAEEALEKLSSVIDEILGVKNLQANLSVAIRPYQLEPLRPDDTLQNHTGLKTIDTHGSNTVVIDSLMQTVPRTKNR